MSAAVLEAPPSLVTQPQAKGPPGGRGVTLEERLEAAWRCAQRDGTTQCPACHALMRVLGSSAHCGGCGSVLR